MASRSSNNDALVELGRSVLPRGLATAHPIFVDRTAGANLWDVEGEEFIDLASGIGVLNVGHRHPAVMRAIQAQLERFTHTAAQVVLYEPYVRLAARLGALMPGAEPTKTLLLTTGAEAVENAVKIARSYTKRPAVVAFTGGFHGRTLLGLSLTGKAHPYKQDFGPFAPGTYHAPYPYEYRGWSSERSLEAFQDLLRTEVDASRVAAVIIEPVLGEGGIVPAPPTFLRELRQITRRHGMLLIADEIQTGFGRTGRMLAIEHSEVEPDLITVAKSLGGGLPLAAVIGRAEVMDAPAPGGLGGTFAGNPVACAAGLAVLDVLENEGLVRRASEIGERFRTALLGIQREAPPIGDVRGLGAMLGMELVTHPLERTPDPQLTRRLIAAGRAHGLILLSAGVADNVVRLLPPLTMDEATLASATERLSAAIAEAIQELDRR